MNELKAAIINALERGENMQEAGQSLINSGYAPEEVNEIIKEIGSGNNIQVIIQPKISKESQIPIIPQQPTNNPTATITQKIFPSFKPLNPQVQPVQQTPSAQPIKQPVQQTPPAIPPSYTPQVQPNYPLSYSAQLQPVITRSSEMMPQRVPEKTSYIGLIITGIIFVLIILFGLLVLYI